MDATGRNKTHLRLPTWQRKCRRRPVLLGALLVLLELLLAVQMVVATHSQDVLRLLDFLGAPAA
jgi:hypothetical protein